MTANQPPRRRNSDLPNQWNEEEIPTIDENVLRDRPEWVERIGDEDEDPRRVEQNLREEWGRLDEDDFVSSPVTESDAPDWTDKDYDDEAGGSGEDDSDDPYRYS
jgi:hypothetical protein